MGFISTLTGKVIGGLTALLVIICAVSWFQTDPATRSALVSGTEKIAAWGGIVLAVPWAAFALIAWVARMGSNHAGAALVASLSLLELLVLGWLFHFTIGGTTAWCFLTLGGLLAALYNLLACDWIAEKLE